MTAELLQKPYKRAEWMDVLRSRLGNVDIYIRPAPVQLAKNKWNAKGFVLGRFITEDGFEVGIYEVTIGNDVRLEKNRVGLRQLLKSVYENDVDAALVVFDQGQRWRFSYISEIRRLNQVTGKRERVATDPKRYTYVFGRSGFTYRTAIQRFGMLSPGFVRLQDITNTFSVAELNEEFYGDVVDSFYQLIGGSIGKGRAKKEYKRLLHLPGVSSSEKRIYQEFAVRLIGRIIFCWFLKFKRSAKNIPLLPEDLLSTDAVRRNEGYYHSILEFLFFQILNTPMPERKRALPAGADMIPFLNGGLFEPHLHDFYAPDRSGLSKNLNTLTIPDKWFKDFFARLEQYNFTIDENSIDDAEVSIDPEMLGRIFENLLAEIDPETGDSARKATGSFYTPREIVDYMVSEAIIQYLHSETGIDAPRLHALFSVGQEVVVGKEAPEDGWSFTKSEAIKLLTELDKMKILDPACGSGAFPIGALQKLVLVLQKLDPDAEWWRNQQIDRVTNALLRRQLKKKLESASVQYTRKLGLIQNNIYGIDIQSIAAEISKLRCFLTLIVDEEIDDSKENRGVEPLPNLEFKFIAGNTLYSLPAEPVKSGNLFGNNAELDELRQLRLDYLQSFGEEKEAIKKQFKELQARIFKDQLKNSGRKTGQLSVDDKVSTRAMKLAQWNPFEDEPTDWFDPEWMYGVPQFDIVMGNPPYGGDKIEEGLKSALGLGSKDPYGAFTARFIQKASNPTPLRNGGILAFIISDTFMTIKTHLPLRQMLLENKVHKMIRVHKDTFKATVNTAITLVQRCEGKATDGNHRLLTADLTQVSIHEKHSEFLRLLQCTVAYQTPLRRGEESKLQNEVLYTAGSCALPDNSAGRWTGESSETYAFYTYPQGYITTNSNRPFFVASPKLFALMNDTGKSLKVKIGGNIANAHQVELNGKKIDVIKLSEVAEVNQGISTGDNKYYLRRSEEGEGYEEINSSLVLDEKQISAFSDQEKYEGVSKSKYDGKHFIPFDKGADSNSDEGWMPNYFVAPEYFIDWSKAAVKRMKTLTIAERKRENGERVNPGDENKIASALRNRDKWFKPSISFSPTGEYSPTFRLGVGTIAQNTSSTILVDKSLELYLLGLLSSGLAKFYFKNFFNHTVHTQEGDVLNFQFQVYEKKKIESLVAQIISKQRKNPRYDYASNEQIEIDRLVYMAYGLNDVDIRELEHWYARRYPRLVVAQRGNIQKMNKAVTA